MTMFHRQPTLTGAKVENGIMRVVTTALGAQYLYPGHIERSITELGSHLLFPVYFKGRLISPTKTFWDSQKELLHELADTQESSEKKLLKGWSNIQPE